MFEFFGEIVTGVILLVVSTVGAYIFNYFKHKKQAIHRNKEDIDVIEDDIKKIKKVLVLVGKKLDKGSKKFHNDVESDFEELVRDLLRD